MKKSLILLVPITSIFVLSVIIATYFMENIFNLLKLDGINFSTILPSPDFEILLYLSLVGIVGIHRNRGNNWSSSYSKPGEARILGRSRKSPLNIITDMNLVDWKEETNGIEFPTFVISKQRQPKSAALWWSWR